MPSCVVVSTRPAADGNYGHTMNTYTFTAIQLAADSYIVEWEAVTDYNHGAGALRIGGSSARDGFNEHHSDRQYLWRTLDGPYHHNGGSAEVMFSTLSGPFAFGGLAFTPATRNTTVSPTGACNTSAVPLSRR